MASEGLGNAVPSLLYFGGFLIFGASWISGCSEIGVYACFLLPCDCLLRFAQYRIFLFPGFSGWLTGFWSGVLMCFGNYAILLLLVCFVLLCVCGLL